MQFKDVIGQRITKQKLIRSVKNKRVSHAQLFLENEGSGGLPLALAYAQYINCQNKTDNDSCGTCPSCVNIQKLVHPDVHFSYPIIANKKEKKKKTKSTDYIKEWREIIIKDPYFNLYQWMQYLDADNKQGNIPVEECQDIIRKLNLKTYESNNKILIIWMPEYLKETGNVLLKTLEEPPDNTIIILVAENTELILNTILSRTQLIKLNKLQNEDIIEALKEKQAVPQETAAGIAHLVDGNYIEALNLLQHNENDNNLLLKKWIKACYKNDGMDIMKWTDNMAKIGREPQKQFIKYAIHVLRESLLMRYSDNSITRMAESEKTLIEYLSPYFDINKNEKFVEKLNKAFYHIERNANPKLLFLTLSIQLGKFLQKKDITFTETV